MTRIVEVVTYNSHCPESFAFETKVLTEALEDNCITVHHIGSTSVPGLAAKPIIDILPVVKDLSRSDPAVVQLEVNQIIREARGFPNGLDESGIHKHRFYLAAGVREKMHALIKNSQETNSNGKE